MTNVKNRPANQLCGLANWHPEWMQRYATTKCFIAIYGLLGTIQAMSYMYFVVTLTTIERRFKIPSETTGIILSGNEISQIMLSLVLTYAGGQRNRPRWIASGIVFCGISCFILALPHFLYGGGDMALQLTKEYWDDLDKSTNGSNILSLVNSTVKHSQQLCGSGKNAEECDRLVSVVPLLLIFLSQFVLGIGNTLYYSLGTTYIDDNTKKTNTPLMLAVAMALRLIGPIFGFVISYVSLNIYIEPTKTPLINNKDPRWMGAWWLGWMILGTLMILFSGLIGLFPKDLPKRTSTKNNSRTPQVLRGKRLSVDEGIPLGSAFSSNTALDTPATAEAELPLFKDFPKALMRLLRNKLLIYNTVSGIFYILGASGYMTFLTKYMEVQFHKNPQSATIVVGPMSVLGMLVGLISSGLVISKKKPNPSKVLMWNVIVGCVYIVGQVSYLFLYCGDSISQLDNNTLNLTMQCNANCACDGVPYSPVCHTATETTYFSPCHAGCLSWDEEAKIYTNCSCASTPTFFSNSSFSNLTALHDTNSHVTDSSLGSDATLLSIATTTTATILAKVTTAVWPNNATNDAVMTRLGHMASSIDSIFRPGVCLEGCDRAFWTFAMFSLITNWFGSSGRIGNVLVNYRSVSTKDKSFAQGLSLMLLSLFALIPGPIIFGRVIDYTCLIWTQTCSGHGNCQLYDQTTFRYLVNLLASAFTSIGVFFDVLVWYYGRDLDLYGEREAQRNEEERRKNRVITPLMSTNS